MKEFQTIYEGGEAEIVEKKSRFIAHTYHVTTEEEVQEILEKVRKEYWDARHNCWAYVLGRIRCLQDAVMTANRARQRENPCWM